MKVLFLGRIGQLALENDFLEGALTKGGVAERKAITDPEHDLSITQQAKVLDISRSTVYYRQRPMSAEGTRMTVRLQALPLSPAKQPLGGLIAID